MYQLEKICDYLLGVCCFLSVLCFFGLVACTSLQDQEERSDREAKGRCVEAIVKMHFIKHRETGLCFAVSSPDFKSLSMTEVPCDKVKDLIK